MSTSDSKSTGAPRADTAPLSGFADGSRIESDWEDPLILIGEARYSQSLERGLAILACFSAERPLLGIAELAGMLGMSRSTTHRYVTTLVALGYLCQGKRRKYRLSLQVTHLGMSAMNSTGLREHARPYVEELSRRSGYTVAVAVLDGSEAVLVERIRGRRAARSETELGLGIGSRLPAHRTAMGMLLLAHLPAREQRELLAQVTLARSHSRVIASKRALREALETIPAQGLASSEEELVSGLIAIAAPIRDHSREVVAAAGVAARSAVISRQRLAEQLGPHLISVADRISERLGYRHENEQSG